MVISRALFLRDILVQQDGFDDLAANRVHRRKGAHRLLEDHGNILAPDIADLGTGGIETRQVDDPISIGARLAGGVKQDLPGVDAPRRRDNAQDRMRRDGFATAAFADDAQHFAAPHGQVDAFHRPDRALVQWKGHPQVFDFQQYVVIHESLPFSGNKDRPRRACRRRRN